MSPNQKSPAFVPPENPSKEGSSDWFYNEIMRNIEPDLLTTDLEKHAKRYAKESKKEHEARMKAYDQAFAVFDSVVAEYEAEMHREVKKVRDAAQAETAREEKKSLEKIEEDIQKND